ncbi:hypothetical protein [Roseateles depolymerans]|uniref:Uncharacterized protein n=1 Tax=Roseateles depolymerans TaxID=76731 RepID=A0A0U2U5J9_9BURK|nr:hypothetical protein [Roseateles depolymerans]ALV07313.1 hypothetical protein RD2015_2849 [Roseateles depolymerans]REG20297.1 hypothetical protein DES44_2805 [Roseateles depolymerans]
MLVRALCLRRQGVKLTPEELRAATPLVGTLILDKSTYKGRDGRGNQVCLLMPTGNSTVPHVELFSARLIRIEQRGILIGGEEDIWKRKKRTTYPQVLWAWPFSPDAEKIEPPKSASSVHLSEFLAQIAAIA